MIFFIFLFFFVFFAIVFLAIQSVTRIDADSSATERYLSPSVSGIDVEKHGDIEEVDSVVKALRERAENPFFSSSKSDQISTLASSIARVSKDVRIIKLEMLVFKMMIAAVSLLMGMIAAFLALTGSVSGFFGS